MKRSIALTFATILLSLIFFPHDLGATNFFTNKEPGDQTRFGFDFVKPNPAGTPYFTFFSGTFYFSGEFPISKRGNLALTLPLSMSTINSDYSGESELGAGNVWAQYKHRVGNTDRGTRWWTVEFFVPTSSVETSSLELSWFGDYYRFPMYYPETASMGLQFADHKTIGLNRTAYRQFELGARMLFSSDFNDETELILNYGFAFGISNMEYEAGIELLGEYFLTADNASFTERTFNQIVLGMSRVIGRTRPKLYYQIPLDDHFNDIIGSVLGLGVDFYLDTSGNGQ